MGRAFFGSGFFPQESASPEFLGLVLLFGGDESAANAYLARLTSYFDDGAQATAVQDQVEAGGTPQDFLAGARGTVATDYQGAPIAPGFVWDAVEVKNTVSTVEVATDYP